MATVRKNPIAITVAARRLFIPAALFNLLAGGLLLLALPLVAGPLGIDAAPAALPFIHMTAAAILLLGWGYWLIAVDPVRNRIVIVMGIVGKIAVVSVAFAHLFAGNLGWGLPALTVADFIWAMMFLRFLRAYPEHESRVPS